MIDHTGKVRGWVPFGQNDHFANYPKGVIPVTNDKGTVVGYDVPSVGFVERSVVEASNFNVKEYADTHSGL
jgi:hypothetical protein